MLERVADPRCPRQRVTGALAASTAVAEGSEWSNGRVAIEPPGAFRHGRRQLLALAAWLIEGARSLPAFRSSSIDTMAVFSCEWLRGEARRYAMLLLLRNGVFYLIAKCLS